jgi:hypothetical protein
VSRDAEPGKFYVIDMTVNRGNPNVPLWFKEMHGVYSTMKDANEFFASIIEMCDRSFSPAYAFRPRQLPDDVLDAVVISDSEAWLSHIVVKEIDHARHTKH